MPQKEILSRNEIFLRNALSFANPLNIEEAESYAYLFKLIPPYKDKITEII